MCVRLRDVFFCLVCVFVCALRSPTVAQGQTWLAMLRFCGHPDQQITGLWLQMGCKSSNKPHGWRGMLKQTGSSGHMRLQPMQFAFTGRVRSLEERLVPFSILQSCHSSAFHTLKPRPRVSTVSTKKRCKTDKAKIVRVHMFCVRVSPPTLPFNIQFICFAVSNGLFLFYLCLLWFTHTLAHTHKGSATRGKMIWISPFVYLSLF